MTLSEAITFIQEGLGFRTDKADMIKRRIQIAQNELENGDISPWFLLSHVILPSMDGWNDRAVLPAGYLGLPEEEASGAWLVPESGTDPGKLVRDDWEIIAAARAAGDGEICLFDIVYEEDSGYVMMVGPGIPDEAWTVAIKYYSSAKELTDDGDTNAWLEFAPEYLLGLAGKKTAMTLRDKEGIAYFQGIQQEARAMLIAADIRHRENSSRDTQRYVPKGARRHASGMSRTFN